MTTSRSNNNLDLYVPLYCEDGEDGEAVETPSHFFDRYTTGQKVGQAVMETVTSFVPTGLFGQIIPEAPAPHGYMVAFIGIAGNHVLGGMAGSLMNKPEPFAGLRATGDGNVIKGVLRESVKIFGTAIFVIGTGYALSTATMRFNDDLLKMPVLGDLVSRPPLYAAALGMVGYTEYRLGMKMWDWCMPGKNAPLNPEACFNILQIMGQYALRFFGGINTTETILFYMRFLGEKTLSADPRFQIGMFLLSDAALQLGHHFSFVPQPLTSFVLAQEKASGHEQLTVIDQESGEIVANAPTVKRTMQAIGWKALAYGMFCGIAYGITELTCHYSPICEEDTLGYRAARFGAAAGSTLAADFAMRHVVPKIASVCASFFNCANRQTEETTPLRDDMDTLGRYGYPVGK